MTRYPTLLLLCSLLGACSSGTRWDAPPAPDQGEASRIPQHLLTCTKRPDPPSPTDSLAEFGGWVVRLDQAGEDCRATVRQICIIEGGKCE